MQCLPDRYILMIVTHPLRLREAVVLWLAVTRLLVKKSWHAMLAYVATIERAYRHTHTSSWPSAALPGAGGNRAARAASSFSTRRSSAAR